MTDNAIKTVEGCLYAGDGKFAIAVSRFNSFISDRLLEGAIDALVRHGADRANITIVRAPGAYELPLVCQRLAAKADVDAVIALGAVIRGSTPHFDFVAAEAAKGLAHAMMAAGKPVAFGVLTCDTIEQAIERAGTKAGNKGADAALSAIETLNVLKAL